MKKLITLILVVGFGFTTLAQTNPLEAKKNELAAAEAAAKAALDKVGALQTEVDALMPIVKWKKGGFAGLNFSQVGLTNWAAGGVGSVSGVALGNIFRNYGFERYTWVNNLDMAYGLIKNGDADIQKNEDKIDFLSKAGYAATDRLSYAGLVNFKSQFAPGFDFVADPGSLNPISKFLAPAYILASVGLDYRLTDHLSVYLSPATGKFTIVNDANIAAMDIYIPNSTDGDGNRYYDNTFRSEFGALFNAIYDRSFGDKIGLRSKLDLFNNYTDVNESNRQNIDVNWETALNMKINKYIGASIFTHVIYDDDINITSTNTNGVTTVLGPRVQFKEVLGLGFSYKF